MSFTTASYKHICILAFALITLPCLLTGCKDDTQELGQSLLGEEEDIIVRADSFHLESNLDTCANIISNPDSFLIGEMVSEYGDLTADLLTQFACPLDYQYPTGCKMDSVCLVLYYTSWTGDGNTPLSIRAYEMDKATLQYSQTYYSDIKISDYCSATTLSHEIMDTPPVIVPTSPIDSGISIARFKMTQEFADKFFAIKDFSSQKAFCNAFKGLYITPTFGNACVLNMSTVAIFVYYHFERSYTDPTTGVAHKDTIYDAKGFYANTEVRQVNRFLYKNKKQLLANLSAIDSVDHIIAPAGIYTTIAFPFKRINDAIKKNYWSSYNKAYVNKAALVVRVDYDISKPEAQKTSKDWMKPAPNMLLVRDTLLKNNEFFRNKDVQLTTYDAILSKLYIGKDEKGYSYYYYSFDLSELLTYKLRNKVQDDVLKMTMVPVDLEYASSTSSNISAIQQTQTTSATIINSPKHSTKPLTLEVVYSIF